MISVVQLYKMISVVQLYIDDQSVLCELMISVVQAAVQHTRTLDNGWGDMSNIDTTFWVETCIQTVML